MQNKNWVFLKLPKRKQSNIDVKTAKFVEIAMQEKQVKTKIPNGLEISSYVQNVIKRNQERNFVQCVKYFGTKKTQQWFYVTIPANSGSIKSVIII